MHLRLLLSTLPALLAGGLAAQTVVYDNGPIETAPGISLLQDDGPHRLTAYGYGIQGDSTIGNSALDDFGVATSMVIDEVEIFAYETGSTTTSTITGVFLEFYDADPSTGGQPIAGSPGIANNLLTGTSVNQWSGLYRDRETAPGSTDRPIMQVRVALPAPLALGAGIYWIQIQALGSSSLPGPWMPPITCLNQPVTSTAMQRIGTTGQFIFPIQSGAAAAQGLPFRLYGSVAQPGSLAVLTPGCGSVTLSVRGAPVLGGFVYSELGNVTGLGLIGYGFQLVPTPFCVCTVGHNWLVAVFTNRDTIRIPMDLSFAGARLGVQGADLYGLGGCPDPLVSFTDTWVMTLNQ
jgi:hypothetical protein